MSEPTTPASVPTGATEPTRQALIVRGGWDGHQPVETTEFFIPFLTEHGFEVRVEEGTAIYADETFMHTVDLIVQVNTMSTIGSDEFAGLQRAVLNGTGMAGWHGGIADSYRDNADYLHMIGGQFAHHAGIAPELRKGEQSDNYLPYTVHITELGKTHPITQGVRDFDLVTEQYWVLSDEYNDVLATTTQAVRPWDAWNRPVTSPAIWTRQWGKGRIFVSAPGHRLEIVQEPHVRAIIERGMLWAARATSPEEPRGGVSKAFPEEPRGGVSKGATYA
ncbi:ThuA domain-containing protein [Gryllotalpicola ginsengisoli]|uniref:ThuA domain-containing protein n=1 Tax=Gryllotalpicola ginsengisoli TaxID=444608 RepID=UPI0003B6DF12|nr:ThuA domain-containing protein [Gryllotalpicola ginsengisoli]